jgi:hypothetical protein
MAKHKPKGKPRGRPFQPGNHERDKRFDSQRLLIEDLKTNRVGTADWFGQFQYLAHHHLMDGQYLRPETRQLLFPLLRDALFKNFLRGPSRVQARHLYDLWSRMGFNRPVVYAQPKSQDDAEALEQMFGPLQSRARAAEAQAAQAEAERLAAQQAAEDKLYASAFLNKEAAEIYREGRLTGKSIIAQLVDGRFLYQGSLITPVTAHLTAQANVAVITWVKKPRSSDYILVDTGDELLWTKPDVEEPWVETSASMTGLSKTETQELHSTKMAEKPGLGKGHAFDVRPITKTVSPRLQKIWERFLQTRKHTFVETGKNDEGHIIGKMTMTSEVNFPFVAEGIRKSEYDVWEANKFSLDSIPKAWSSEGSLRDVYAGVVAQGIKSIAAATAEKFGRDIVRDVGDVFDVDAPFKAARPEFHGMKLYGREPQQPKPIASLPGDISHFIESLDRAERVEPTITALTKEEAENYGTESRAIEQRRRVERQKAGLDPLGGTRSSRKKVRKSDYSSSQVGVSALYHDASVSRSGFDI